MSIKDGLKNLFVKLGKNNKPTYAVVAIAVVKGIARPIFTMTDKHADPETKKYTAIREGLTEVVAIPTYLACGELAGKVAEKLNFDHIPDTKERAFARQGAKQNFMFLGVCLAALAIIPALASVTIKPFMKKIQDSKKENKKALEDVKNLDSNNVFPNINKGTAMNQTSPNFNGRNSLNKNHILYNSNKMGGMKVGGL